MKTLHVFLFTTLFVTFFFGCQKKESFIETLPEPEISVLDTTSEPDPDLETDGPKIPEENYEHCNINFMIFDRMLKKMVMETYVQSAIADMPGLKGRHQQLTASCPETSLSSNTNYPTTMTLDYGAGCNPIMSPGELIISGVLEIVFSGPMDQPETTVTLRPQDNFVVGGYDIDVSDPDALTFYTGSGFDYEMTILEGENVSVTDANGSVTEVGQIAPGNVLLYDNNGTDGGPLDILDDTFWFSFDEISMSCGNGSQLTVIGEEELMYSLECECIQDGRVSIYEQRELVNTSDFGYSEDGEEGSCDDQILVTTPINEQDSEGQLQQEVITCP